MYSKSCTETLARQHYLLLLESQRICTRKVVLRLERLSVHQQLKVREYVLEKLY